MTVSVDSGLSKATLEPYLNKTVVLVTADADGSNEQSYTCVIKGVAPEGILAQIRGSSKTIMPMFHQIVSVTLSESDSTFKPKKMTQIDTNKVRRHLLDHHGVTINYVTGLSDIQAEVVHEQLHVDRQLGHYHASLNEVSA